MTGETCPHYLTLTDQDMERLGAPAKCAPPLRSAEEVERLWSQVFDGGIELIASDHSPAPASMKQSGDFFNVWGGIAGVQSTRSILLSREPPLHLGRVAQMTASNVANRFSITNKGQLAVGFDADLALIDLASSYKLAKEQLLDRHRLSPYVGRSFRGIVRRTMVRGETVFQDGKSVGSFRGRFIRPVIGDRL